MDMTAIILSGSGKTGEKKCEDLEEVVKSVE